jgi:hypothetical protein
MVNRNKQAISVDGAAVDEVDTSASSSSFMIADKNFEWLIFGSIF